MTVEELDRNLQRYFWIIAIAAIVLVVGLGGWAATTEFAGAIIAPGQVVVNSYHKKIQHPTGGVVGELRVGEGDRVKAGDILVRLDETQTKVNLAIVVKALDEMAARQAREEAERDGADKIEFPADLLARMDNPDVARAVNGERRQFEVRSTARTGQRSQLKERASQLKEEISGDEAQVASKVSQIKWINKELEGVNDLWKKNLVPYTRVTTLEREKERLEGERGQLVAAIAQAKGKTTEINLQILQIDQDMRSEVGKDLAEIRAKTAELVEKKVAAEDLLRRIDIRAPIDGTVFQLAVHTVGGVIGPAEVIALVVPTTDTLEIEARVQPQDIDQIRLGQPAMLRFTAFNMRTTPELDGQVNRISADVSDDQKTGAHYFTIRIAVPPSELAKLGDNLRVISGMPVESFVHTSSRTVISYLMRPLADQLRRAFREK